jgi:putative aldouronate transport system permease protein
MINKVSKGEKVFSIFNYIFLSITAFICLIPIINVLALSFSTSTAAASGLVKLLPVDFTLESYNFIMDKPEFITSLLVTLKRVSLGVIVNMVLVILVAYPLSKETNVFRGRNIYAWFFLITMLFSGGLIPAYMTIKKVGIIDTVWALVLPGSVPVFNVLILMNFMRGLPKEIEESAFIDGAGPWTSLLKIVLPLSIPSLATITLFTLVGHWNSWFDGLIYMNNPKNYPLQSYLQTVVISRDLSLAMDTSQAAALAKVSDRTTKSAQVFLAALPIMMVYPFLQRYFMTGLVMGSVKG